MNADILGMVRARLDVTDALGSRTIPIDKDLFLIGRRSGHDLHLDGADVSRDHAEIARKGDRFTLRDRGSQWGTFVNGEPIAERVLEHGDRIRLGRTDAIELVFATDGAKTTGFLDASSVTMLQAPWFLAAQAVRHAFS